MQVSNVQSEAKRRTWVRKVSRWGVPAGILALMPVLMGLQGCPCGDDADCAGGAFCVDTVCVDCRDNADCSAELPVCVDTFCEECGVAADCDDGDACTTDTCDDDNECVNDALTCDDGDVCTDDSCDEAIGCVNEAPDCDDLDDCTDDSCDAETGDCVNEDVVCPEGETCLNGDCTETCVLADDCDDDDACTDDACLDGACSHTDQDCDDGVACTDDSCDGGECDNVDNCPTDETCNTTTGLCEQGVECTEDADCTDDGLFCNGTDVCDTDLGACVAGSDPCAATVCTCEGVSQTPDCAEGDTSATCTCPTCPSIDFTLGQDNLTGSTGDDVFNGALVFNPSSGTQVATVQTGDSANGLAGNDVLNASFNTAGTVVPTLADIEDLRLTNFSTGVLTLSATNVSGVNTIYQVGSVNDLVVTGMQEMVDIGFMTINDTLVDLDITFAQSSTTAGSSDAIGISLENATVGDANIITNAANGFEAVNFTSNGTTDNRLTSLTQGTGTSMATANYTGTANLKVDVIPTTILTHDASALSGGLTLGTGTCADQAGTVTCDYVTFGNPTSNFVAITGGSGNDLIIFGSALATTDFTTGTLDLGDGTDVVQNTFSTTFGAASKLRNVEEVRYNATATVSVNFSGHTGLTMITNEGDGTANVFTLSNVPATSGTFPGLNFRGNNTQAAQVYDTITYTATGATGTGDALAITVGNRGTALNAGTSTTNGHTIGTSAIIANSFENCTVVCSDGPCTFSGITMTGLTSFTATGSSNVTMGTVAPASGVTVTTMNASGVVGNFNATFGFVASGATYTGGVKNDTVTFAANSTATSTVVTLGEGNNTFTGDTNTSCADTITSGSGNDTLTPGPGADTMTVGSGSDTIHMDTTDMVEQVTDTVTDFTIDEDTITFDITSLEAMNVEGTGTADDMVDFGQVTAASGNAFTIEVITTDPTTAGSAIDMAVISDALATYTNAAAYIAATTATVVWSGGTVVAGDIHLLAYEDGSNNTRIGVFADAGGGGANTDAWDVGADVLILSGVNAASLTDATFNNWN
ncbi:MAG: hypothetical protein IIC01_01660 [Planctomycetes bacterium]|nr:hypothetical protein [Planctomycetota bacterium]